MGLFDYIKFSTTCPTCGKEINEFQSKDADWPCINYLEFWEVDHFYGSCDWCGTRIKYIRTRTKPASIEEYCRTVTPLSDEEATRVIRDCTGRIVGFKAFIDGHSIDITEPSLGQEQKRDEVAGE